MLRHLLLTVALLSTPSIAAPDNPPVPLPKPQQQDTASEDGANIGEVPVPESKPEEPAPAAGAETGAEPGEKAPDRREDDKAPASEEAPSEKTPEKPDEQKEEKPAPPPPPPVEKEDEATYDACIGELKSLGVTFREVPRIDDGDGCGIDRPVAASTLSADVTVEPEVTARCETVLQLARMTRDFVEPAASLGLPDMGELKTVRQASGYICRKRNSAETGKISEHARGNAVDIAALEFEKGTVAMEIAKPEDSDLAAAFQRAFNAFACLYFTTVLSPGSDSTHQDHMHLDVIERKGGYRYCR